jgi:integrase
MPSTGLSVFPYTDNDFQSYLNNSKKSIFTLDLSNATLMEVIDELIKMKSRLSPNYAKSFSTLRLHLAGLEKQFHCTLLPHQITDIFWHNFIPFLIGKGLALSSVKKACSQLRTALDWGAKHRATISPTYDLVKIPPYCRQQVALTQDEVSHIYHFDISTIKRRPQHLRKLEAVRDMFVLSCNLGQRFSDMVRIDRSCFDCNIFTILQQKTGTYARVDIERMSLDRNTTYAILEKYGYRSPVTTDISCYDRYLKELLQYVGFKELIKRETKVNGVVEVTYEPKWKLISSHTARRTFATNNLVRGLKTSEIRRATGHKSESAFEKYICYFDE